MTMSDSPTQTVPRTILEVMELVSELRSRKAAYQTAIAHLRTCYMNTDAGEAEMRMAREGDQSVVPQLHIEKSIIEMEGRIDLLDAEIETLQNQPVGGSTPPVAEVAVQAEKAEEELAETIRTSAKKGTQSGKSRAQGGRPS